MVNSLKAYYFLSFLGSLSFNLTASLFIIYGLSLGLDIFKVTVLFGASRLAVFLFELPTGIWADKYGRKKSVLLAYFFMLLSSLIYFFSGDLYFALLLGSVISGLATAFISGAFEALLVDSLDLKDKHSLRDQVYVKMTIIATVGFFVGGIIAGVIAYFNLVYIWLAQAIVSLFALVFAKRYLLEKFYTTKQNRETTGRLFQTVTQIRDDFSLILKSKIIIQFLFISVILAMAIGIYLVSWPIFFKDILEIPIYYFGVISGVAALTYALGALFSEKISSRNNSLITIIVSALAMAMSLIIFAFSKNIWLSILAFLAIDFFNGGFGPLFDSLFNRYIPSEKRATVLSIRSLFTEASMGVGEMATGKMLSMFNVIFIILISPFLIAVISIVALFHYLKGFKKSLI